MNQYYEYEDLKKFKKIEERELKKTSSKQSKRTEVYFVPDSGEFYEDALEDILPKYDIEFVNAEQTKHVMVHVLLQVLSHGKEESKEYDIKTFKYPYSDAVLKCCLKDFLNFESKLSTNKRNGKFCMTGYSVGQVSEMLEDYTKRHNLLHMKQYKNKPNDLWLICYEYKDDEKTSLFTLCIDCTSREKFVYDIYITDTYEEMVDKLIRSYEYQPIGLRNICVDDEDVLNQNLTKAFPFTRQIYDVLLIPLRLDEIISHLNHFNLCRKKLEDFRQRFFNAFEKCCKRDATLSDIQEAMMQFVKTYDELKLFDFSKMPKGDTVTEQLKSLWKVVDRWSDKCEYDVFEMMKYCHRTFHSMETYRIQYLLTVFLYNTRNISAERLRLKLLSSYDLPNGEKVEIRDKNGKWKYKIVRVGDRISNCNSKYKRKLSYACMFKMPRTDFELIHLISKSQIRYISNKHNILIRRVVRAKKIQPIVLDPEMRISNCLYRKKYRLKLKPVLGPRLREGDVTLSDVIKRLEKLVYDM